MSTEAVGSSSSSAAAQAWAAQAAAEAARRRAAEEAARKAAEEARRAAEAARKAAEEARRKADEARKAAEAAEAKAAKSKAKADAEDAQKLREKAKTEELAALKAEATANLRKKEETLANSKVDDAKQGRDAKAPSENTRAAQTEVDGAKQTVALYDAPKDKKDSPLEQGSKKTQDLLDKAEKALDKVCSAKAKGETPSEADKDALDLAVNDWLESAQHDMRVAALSAQASGDDPQAAVKAQADKVSQSVKDGGMFIPEDLDKFINSARDKVLDESGAVRQVRAEEYVVQKEGEKQLADTRKDLPKLDADAEAAEAYAKRFSHASTDSQFDAMQAAQDDAVKKRAAATAAHQKVEGLSLAYEGSVDEKTGSSTPGSVEADYESRVADLDVKDKSAKLDQANAGGDQKAIDAAGVALDKAITNQTLAHSDRDVSAAKLEAADSLAERDAVQKTYDARKKDLPKDHDPALTLDYNNEADRKRVQFIDGKYYYVTHTPAKTTYSGAGKGWSSSHTEKAKDEKRELDPLTAQVWAANEKLDADKKTVDTAVATKTQAEKDLLSPDGKTAAKLDTTPWLSHEKDINDKLGQAKNDVATAQANLDNGLKTNGPVDLNGLRVALGTAKKNQEVAQADVDALNAMRELRDAQRQEASGQVCMDPVAMDKLRQKARTAVDNAANAGPELNPENEKKARDDLKEKLADLKKQDDVVKTTQTAYDKAVGTDKEAAKLKERDDALAKRGDLDRTVRNYQTLLDKIDAERLALAAPDEYAKHKFVKPQLSMYMDGDHSATADFISRDYNPTWSITPDANGKVKADGLPRGIKPEDVEVKKEGNDWVVVFKKDSDVLGVVAEGKTHQQYRVHEGTVKMDEATARLWETNKKLADATKARSDFLAEVKDVGVPSGKTPQIGPDGKALPTLSLADDLSSRRQQVASDITRYTRESRGESTPPAELATARAELKAIDAAIAWQEADRARQSYDADVRAGTVSMCYAKSPQENADDLRADAVKARSDWLSLRNNQDVDSARSDLKLKQGEYDKWKAEHPYLSASEKESDSWKAVQAAQDKLDLALRYQTAGANVQAQSVYEQYLADKLSPEKAKDPAALYQLFMDNPQAMAQSFINQHYIENGGLPLQMDGRVHLENEVALAFGWTPSIALDPSAPADSQELRRKTNIFTDLSDAQKKTLKATVDKIVDLGGEKAKITVLPVMYALPGEKGGIVKTAIFKVERDNAAAKFVDENGREYTDVRDFRANNLLPVENVNLAMPEDGNMSLDKNGNVKLFTGDARTETGFQTFRRVTHADEVVGAVGFVAGVVLAVGSFGSLSVPGALLMAASATMFAAGVYGVVTSTQSLEEQADHGVDINPITNRQARMDWLNLGLSVASVPVAGAGMRSTFLAWRAAEAAKAAEGATGAEQAMFKAKSVDLKDKAAAWNKPGQILDKPLKVGGGLAFEEGVRYMADSWSEMTPAQRRQQIGMLGLNAMSFASHPVGRAYEQTHLWVKGQFNGGGVEPVAGTTKVTTLRTGANNDGTTPVDGPDAAVIPINRRTTGSNGDETPVNMRPASARTAGAGNGKRTGDGSTDPLHPFRDPAAHDESAVPDNVTPLHPRGVPELPPEPVHAAVAPVIELNPRGVFDGPEPSEPGSMPLAASNPRIEMLRLAAGGEEHSDRTRVELPPQRPALRTVNPQLSANPTGNSGGGNTGGGTPGGSSNPANVPANPQGGQAIQMSANSQGGSGGGNTGGGNTGSTPGGSSNPANVPANPQGGQVVQTSQTGAQGQSPASGQPQSPAQQAATAAPGTPSQGGGNDPGNAQPDAGQLAHLVSEPAPDSGTRFVVSGEDLGKHLFANGVGAKRRNTFTSFDDARQAAAAKGGAQVHRIEPDETLPSLASRGRAQPHEIVGAVKVNAAGEVNPVGVLNPHSAAASVPQVQPQQRSGHPYNSALTVNVGRPFEDIFLQGGIEAGADLAGDVLAQAIGDKGTANIVMATGYSSGRGKPETGGPGGAAVAGRSLRIRAQDEHGVALKVKYVVDRKHADVMKAALEALGEQEGTDFEVLTFNARGRWAKGRSQAFLDKHQPDLMMAFDVPGRTPEGRYVNANGKSVKWFNSARDQLFIDAKGRNIKTISAFDLGNEVGGGNVHDNVRPAANGKPMASVVETDVAMTGGRTNWVGYAFAHEMLRRAGSLEKAPTEQQIQKMVVDMLDAGAIDSVTGGRVAGEVDEQGHVTGVGGMSPTVEAALFNILKQRASQAGAAPNLKVDLRGIRLRLGVFDSGSGGIIAAADIRRVVQETTGAIVDLVIAGDHGAGTYGPKPKDEIAAYTLKGLQTLDELGCDLIVMACNTACTSGKGAYANGIKAQVIDLIESTREFHANMVKDAAERGENEVIVAFSTKATATLPLPGTQTVGVYKDTNVHVIGGTDNETTLNLAKLVNEYMPNRNDPDKLRGMQEAANHYVDVILQTHPDVTTISWCCTHYPELEPFFAIALKNRNRTDVKMVNPMEYQAGKAIEVAQTLEPGMGTHPSRVVGLSTAVLDKLAALKANVPADKASVDAPEVLQTLRIALQRPDVELVSLEEFGKDVDVSALRKMLDRPEVPDRIEALRAFDPTGRGSTIHVDGGATHAAQALHDGENVLVLAGYPLLTETNAAGKPVFKADSDSIKGGVIMASGLLNAGKKPVIVTSSRDEPAFRAGLKSLGHADDEINIQTYDRRGGKRAQAAARRILRDNDIDTVVGVELPGRDAAGKYWDSRGVEITKGVASLDEFFIQASELNKNVSAGQQPIKTISVFDVGNEPGGGNMPNRVKLAPNGQRISSSVTADILVTSGMGSWGADATVAALSRLSGNHALLPEPAQVVELMKAIKENGGHDSVTRANDGDAGGFNPTVHAGMVELFRQAARGNSSDDASRIAGVPPKGPKGPKGASPKATPPDGGKPGSTPAAAPPADPALHAAFNGKDWPSLWNRLRKGEVGKGTMYVYRVKGDPALYADPSAKASFSFDEIKGWGRVTNLQKRTVRWYGRTVPGEGVRGMLPHREMGRKLGMERPSQVVYTVENLRNGNVRSMGTTKPKASIYRNPNRRVTEETVRGAKQARAQSDDSYFVVSNKSPAQVRKAGGLRDVPRGDDSFSLPSPAAEPKLPTGWKRPKILRRQAALLAVTIAGMTVANAVSPIQYGHDVPTGALDLPRNPIAMSTQHPHADNFDVAARPLSTDERIDLATAVDLQSRADKARMAPNADANAVKAQQDQADNWWSKFSAASLKRVQEDAQRGVNPIESANALRAQLISQGKFSLRSDSAIKVSLQESGLVNGGEKDFMAQIEYAQLVAKDKAFVNDQAHRDLAMDDPVAFAGASLIEIGPMDAAFQAKVKQTATDVGRSYSSKVIRDSLADGDVATAALEARTRLDASSSASERAETAAQLVPLFKGERERAMSRLDDASTHEIGDYLAQFRDAPPEVAEPMAQAVLDRIGDKWPHNPVGLAGSGEYEPFLVGLSTLTQAADARQPTPVWSNKMAQKMFDAHITERQEFRLALTRSVKGAVEAGDSKLPIALANLFQNHEPSFLRDSVLGGIEAGLQAQKTHLGEALGNLRGTAGYNAAGSSMMFYLENFVDANPAALAQAAKDYRQVNPEMANRMDESLRVVGQWGKTLHDTRMDLMELNGNAPQTSMSRRLDAAVTKIYGDDTRNIKMDPDVEIAIQQSQPLKKALLARARQGVPDPRTVIEYAVNPAMFVTRHISGTIRMTWSLMADAQFNAMMADPVNHTAHWEAFKARTERMATSLGLAPDEVRQGTTLVDDYLKAVNDIDKTLPEARQLQEITRLSTELSTKIEGVTGVGAKTINNVANAHTAFGQTLRWAANVGFVTHNISTEITNFRPLSSGVQDYAKWYHRIYAPTQAFFMLKPYTSVKQTAPMAASAIQAGKAADIESMLKWKYIFGAGTLGVGVADSALAFGQQGTVPNWVTFVNYGMGVSGIVDGGITLVNTTGTALARAGAVELGSMFAMAPEAATIGGLGVALFTGIKQFYNVRHHYDVVDAREAQRDPALKNMLLARGFDEKQAQALLDCTHEGLSPMLAFNQMLKRHGMTVEQGLAWLQQRVTDDSLKNIPSWQDWTHQSHHLLDDHLNQEQFTLPGTDPSAKDAGTWHTETQSAEGVAYDMPVLTQAESLDGLYSYLTRVYGPLQ